MTRALCLSEPAPSFAPAGAHGRNKRAFFSHGFAMGHRLSPLPGRGPAASRKCPIAVSIASFLGLPVARRARTPHATSHLPALVAM